jgi:flagellar hook-length control protein FliK
MSSNRNKFDLSGIDFRASDPVKPKARAEVHQTRPQHSSFKQMMARHQPEPVAHQSGESHLSKAQLKQNAQILQNGPLDHSRASVSAQAARQSADFFTRSEDQTDSGGAGGTDSESLEQVNGVSQDVTLKANKNGQSLGVAAQALLATRGTGSAGVKLSESLKVALKNIDGQTEDSTLALACANSSSNPDALGSPGLDSLQGLDLSTPLSTQQHGLASDNSSSASANPSQLYIPTPFGQEAWVEAFEQKLTWLVTQNDQQASLTLNPPELGPLKIVLHIKQNVATASFSSDNPEVRHVLAAQQASLRESFSRQDIYLHQITIQDCGAQAQSDNKNRERAVAQAISPESVAAARSDVSVTAAPLVERPGRTLSQKLVNLYA